MERIGMDASYRQHSLCTLYTLEMHMHYLREVKGSDTVAVSARIIAADHKRIHAAFELYAANQAEPAATAEVMLLHVQQSVPVASKPFPPALSDRIGELMRASASPLEAPALPGSRRMQLPQR
jgi:acyl-CoA thioester hydrolase